MSFLSLVQSINRHLAAMEGPSTRIIQKKNIWMCERQIRELGRHGERAMMLCGRMSGGTEGAKLGQGKEEMKINHKHIFLFFI